ncbi:hypothetical protein NUW58_g8964 [Xylaria curta]|uniref:Uncharacterized protein n=1 Tax=Xylaria curta TaxID=42375 RepID=A0ACC1N4E8_9PEZI|nr:hypothetical protein NUW58_g8964 [Xylaria curta]
MRDELHITMSMSGSIGRCDEEDADDAAPARVLHMCSGHESALPNTHPTLTATANVFINDITGVIGHHLHSDNVENENQRALSHYFFKLKFFLRNHDYGDELGLNFQPNFKFDLKSQCESDFRHDLKFGLKFGLKLDFKSNSNFAPWAAVDESARPSPDSWNFARCLRRRRYPDSDSEKAFFQNDNSTGNSDPFGSRGSHIFHISPPVLGPPRYRPDFGPRVASPASQVPQPEPPMQPTNIDRNTIGLAISRPRSLISKLPLIIHSPAMSSPRVAEAPIERKPSVLLPPRPALTIDIPSNTAASGAPSSQAPPTKDRASTLTNMTTFADLDSEAAEGEQTWRPPPTDPQSATTLYVADRYGNWVLSNNHRQSQIAQVMEAAELDTYTPLTKSPIEKQEETAKMAAAISAAAPRSTAPQPTFLSKDPANWTRSQSSSLYSQTSSGRQTAQRNSSGRNGASRTRKGNGVPVINRSDSKASVTTIQTSSTGANDDGLNYENDVARLSQLSPVKESPSPATGRSRITYPKIPGRLDGATIRHVPPPKRPNFAASSLGQPSPTLGVVYPIEDSPSAYPLPLNPRRNERQLAPVQRTGSGFTPEPPNYEVFPLQPYGHPEEVSRLEPSPRSDLAPAQPAKPYRYVESPQRDAYRTPTLQAVPTFTPSPLSSEKRPATPPQPSIMNRGRPHIATQRAESGASFGTVSSATSSLLAKRLGSDRAAAFALDPSGMKSQQWRQQSNDDRLLSPSANSLASPRGTLPQTPIWQPKLTPTRRGGDLYLNVQ